MFNLNTQSKHQFLFSLIFGLFISTSNIGVSEPVYSLQNVGDNLKTAVVVQALKDQKTIGSGTGFMVAYSTSEVGGAYFFIVTAKHVIKDANAIQILFNRNLNRHDEAVGKTKIVTLPFDLIRGTTTLWQPARDEVDIGVVFMKYEPNKTFQKTFQRRKEYLEGLLASKREEVWLDNPAVSIPNDMAMQLPDQELLDIFYTGYPLGIHSGEWLHSFTRRCTVALLSSRGIPINGLNPNDFIIDCSPFEGDSGSPVFMRSVYLRTDGRLSETSTKLVGVMLGYLSWEEVSKTLSQTRDIEINMEIRRKNILGLGKVAPARYILSAIEDFLSKHPLLME